MSGQLSIWLRNGFRVFVLSGIALVLFSATALLCGALISFFTRTPLFSQGGLWYGVIAGLISWLFILVFHIKKETVLLQLPRQFDFINGMKEAMSVLGYQISELTPSRVVGVPTFRAFLFGGSFQATLKANEVTLTGPKYSIEKIRHQLRLAVHLNNGAPLRTVNASTLGDLSLFHFSLTNTQPPEVFREIMETLKLRGIKASCEIELFVEEAGGNNVFEIKEIIQSRLNEHSPEKSSEDNLSRPEPKRSSVGVPTL